MKLHQKIGTLSATKPNGKGRNHNINNFYFFARSQNLADAVKNRDFFKKTMPYGCVASREAAPQCAILCALSSEARRARREVGRGKWICRKKITLPAFRVPLVLIEARTCTVSRSAPAKGPCSVHCQSHVLPLIAGSSKRLDRFACPPEFIDSTEDRTYFFRNLVQR